MIESLGICYLGMVLLRLPISLGEIYRYLYLNDPISDFISLIASVRHLDGQSKKIYHLLGLYALYQRS